MDYQTKVVDALQRQDTDLVFELIAAAEPAHGEEADFFALKAMVAMSAGDNEAARDILLSGLRLHPADGDLLYNLGYVSELLGNKRSAYWYYFEARQYLGPDLIAEADAALRQLSEEPDVLGDGAVSVLSEEEVHSQNFSRWYHDRSDIEYLLRRAEFGHDIRSSMEVVRHAINAAKITMGELMAFVGETDLHTDRYIRLFRENL